MIKRGSSRQTGIGTPANAAFIQAVTLAVQYFNAGRLSEADEQARIVLKISPADPSALNICAAVAMERGRTAEALSLFRSALAGQPKNPFIQFNLGEAYRRGHAFLKALPWFERAAALKPDFAQAIAMSAECLRALGRDDEAERHFRCALEIEPTSVSAKHGLGLLLLQRGAPLPAADLLSSSRVGIAADHPLKPSLLSNLGLAYLQLGQVPDGLEALSQAVQSSPGTDYHWRLLASSLKNTKVAPAGKDFRDILLRLFGRADVNPRDLATASLALLAQDDNVDRLLRDIEVDPSNLTQILENSSATVAQLVQDQLFLGLVANAPVSCVSVELLLVRLRADLLSLIEASAQVPSTGLTLVISLAQQSFLNEYVQYVSPDEDGRIALLIGSLDRDDLGDRPGDEARIGIVASYRPLGQTSLAARLSATRFPELAQLIRQQIDEPRREAQLRETLRVLKPAQNPVSIAVQRQYEESPYPRWTRSSISEPVRFRAAIRTTLPHIPEATIPDIFKPRVLIAGCGTGLEIMRVLNTYEHSSVLAVDLSSASLGYAMRKMEEYGRSAIQYLQADILDLPSLTERFDLIESFGVLHHMADPFAGLRVLCGLMKPKGLMSIGLYSEIGRQAIVRTREHIAQAGYTANLSGIRALRRELLTKRPPDLDGVVSPASDFWTTSDCRDLLFHVNEHRFTLPQIGATLRDAGLEFLGLEFSDSADRFRFLEEYSFRGAIQDVEALHRHEKDNPELFGDTYRIWARRSRHERSRPLKKSIGGR